MAEPGAAPHSQLRVTWKDEQQDVALHEMSRAQVETYLGQYPNAVVLRAPSAAALQSEPDAVAVISYRHPYTGDYENIPVTRELVDAYDLFSIVQMQLVSHDMFDQLITHVPIAGGRRRRQTKNKKTRKGKGRKGKGRKTWRRRA